MVSQHKRIYLETIDLLSIIPPPCPLPAQDIIIDESIEKAYKTNLHQ